VLTVFLEEVETAFVQVRPDRALNLVFEVLGVVDDGPAHKL